MSDGAKKDSHLLNFSYFRVNVCVRRVFHHKTGQKTFPWLRFNKMLEEFVIVLNVAFILCVCVWKARVGGSGACVLCT